MDDLLPVDVMARLNMDFGDRADAVAALFLAQRLDERLVRCIVFAARGSVSRVQELIALAQKDFRDLIVTAEYDEVMRQIRDLRVSFLTDGPETFWISEVACMMASRGYRLTSIETLPATAGPFAYTADEDEGRATFVGPRGEFRIEKTDRLWTIHADRRDIETHNLDHAFSDEQAFRDAVSGYLLSPI
jgi:hypothetical protein